MYDGYHINSTLSDEVYGDLSDSQITYNLQLIYFDFIFVLYAIHDFKKWRVKKNEEETNSPIFNYHMCTHNVGHWGCDV